MKNLLIKQVMLTAIFFMGAIATLSATIDGKTFTKYVCDDAANNSIDLSLDVVGNGFTPDGGQWDFVDNSVTDPNSYDPSSQKLAGDVSNIFVMTGKKQGTYKYVFTATGMNACIPVNTKVMAVVVVLETPKPFSKKVALCENETYTVDLNTIVSSSLPNNKTYTLTTTTGVTLSNSTLAVDGNYTGDILINYTVEQLDIEGNVINVCNDAASIIISINRDGDVPIYSGADNISTCIDEFPASINLNNRLSTLVPSGTWSVATTGTGNPTISDGKVTFNNPTSGDIYTFTYNYPETTCYSAGSLEFTYTLTDDLSTAFVDNTKTICKADNPTQIIDMLRDGLKVDIPLSSGSWVVNAEVSDIDVTDGLFEVLNAKPGKYNYSFKVSSAAAICGLSGKSSNLELSVIDTSNSQDGRVEFCIADIEDANNSTVSINLSDYVAGLPAGSIWTSTDFTNLTNGTLTYADLATAGTGTHKLDYSYSAGVCGEATGSLYITITDEIDMADNYALKYCRPDMPTAINLNQAIGIGAEGTWVVTSGNAGTYQLIGNVFSEQGTVTGEQTYVLTFTPSSTQCGMKETTVTIVVTAELF